MISPQALIEKFQYALDNNWGYIWGTAGVMWTASRQAQLEKTTDSDRKSGREHGSKWIGHMVADCSGMFSWAFKQLGGYMYNGSNTMWDKYCVHQGELRNGKRTDGQDLKPGTAIFTHSTEKRGHVGLYIGNGWVIEASGTINGVIKTKITISKWVEWGELKGVDYGEPAQDVVVDPDENPVYGTIRKGDRGPVVRYAQRLLLERGYKLPRYGSDGDYGSETAAAVKAFQKDWGLTQDGIVGPKTWERLMSTVPPAAEKTYTVTITGQKKAVADEIISRYGGTMMAEG